ncbi:MAG: monovalent cation/H(+) antiporter subunit G [Caldilineales bacterium]|nr:monovalent cation/H(+) antiporter subunit G [Caldilineales bacterium]
MDAILQIIAIFAVISGAAFSILGLLGVIRMPDVYTRLHATGKVGVFGVVFLLIAAIVWLPAGRGKALMLILFLLLAGPVTAHALASAAYRTGIPFARPIRDDLEHLASAPLNDADTPSA